MKSKTSLFNRTIFKKNITHYWPAWALYLVYLFLAMPYFMWIMLQDYDYYNELEAVERGLYAINGVVRAGMMVPVIFVVSTIMAMLVFSYLYTARNANMIHALPVTRTELFITNYLSGLAFLLIPQILTFIVTALVALVNNVTCIQYAFYGMLCAAGMTIFFYSMAVFVAMFTGQVLAVGAYSLIINLLYVGCVGLVGMFQSMVSYGASGEITIGQSAMLSPLYYLWTNTGVDTVFGTTGKLESIQINGYTTILGYTVVGIVLIAAAYVLYQRRHVETAGDLVSIGIIKPIFRWGVAVCGGFTMAMLFASSTNQYKINKIYLLIIIGVLVFGILCFFLAEMLLEKNFRVFKKNRLIECGVLSVLSVLVVLLFRFDAFGIERYQPKAEEIEKAFVYMDFVIDVDDEDVDAVLELQKEIIKNKNEYLDLAASTNTGYYYTTFRYYLKDGTCYTRRYPVPTTEEYLGREDSAAVWLLAYEKEPKRMARNILGTNYEENIYFSANISVHDEGDTYHTETFGTDGAEEIAKALLLDIEEGNMSDVYLYALQRDTFEEYSGIELNYVNPNGNPSVWSYYYDYFALVGDQAAGKRDREKTENTSVYVRLTPQCRNLLKVLNDLGITEDMLK